MLSKQLTDISFPNNLDIYYFLCVSVYIFNNVNKTSIYTYLLFKKLFIFLSRDVISHDCNVKWKCKFYLCKLQCRKMKSCDFLLFIRFIVFGYSVYKGRQLYSYVTVNVIFMYGKPALCSYFTEKQQKKTKTTETRFSSRFGKENRDICAFDKIKQRKSFDRYKEMFSLKQT